MRRRMEIDKIWFHFPDGEGQWFEVGKASEYFKNSEKAKKIIMDLKPEIGYLRVIFKDGEIVDFYGTFTVTYKEVQ